MVSLDSYLLFINPISSKFKSLDSLFWFPHFDLTSTCHFSVFMSMTPGSSLITMLALKHVHKSLTNTLNSSNNQYIPRMEKYAIECFLTIDEDIFHYTCAILWIFKEDINSVSCRYCIRSVTWERRGGRNDSITLLMPEITCKLGQWRAGKGSCLLLF